MKILYFAWLRTRLGRGEEEIELPEGVGTVGQLIDHLRERGGLYADALDDLKAVRMAVNEEYATLETDINERDELALFPPVTGG